MTGMPAALARWFVAPPRPQAPAVLFCLPYAGAGTSPFQGWAAALGPDVDVQPVVLPGRQARIAETPEIDVAAVASALAARVDRPYAIYGHSLGGRLGFEVVRELRRHGAPPPLRLYVGGCRPPDTVDPPDAYVGLWRLGERELVARLVELRGMPEELPAEPELLDLVLPAVRSDFAWLDGYGYRPEPPLPMPIVAFAGAADPVVPPLDMLGWARHTSAGFSLRTEPGDHFFLGQARDRLAAAIRADLLAAVAGAAEGPELDPPDEDEVHLWVARLDDLPDLAAATAELSPGEAARAARLRFRVDRERYVARSALLRRVLSRYGLQVGTAELPTARAGKPRPPDGHALRFNASHSSGTALIAVASGQEVGVDVERLAPLADLDAFCSGALHPDELAEYRRVPPGRRLEHALRLWTAKEAVLKASGDGLGVEPSRVSFAGRAAPPWRPLVPPDLERLARWRVTHLDVGGAIGAVAVERERWRLRLEVVRS